MDDDAPLVVYVFKGLLIGLEILLVAYSFLLALYIRYALEPVLESYESRIKEVTIWTVLVGWVPRFLVCYGIFGLLGVQTFVVAYIVAAATTENSSVSQLGAVAIACIAVGTAILSIIGIAVIRRRFTMFKEYKYNLRQYVSETLDSALDLGAGFLAIVTCMFLVRLRQMNKIGEHEGASERWRILVVKEFGMTFLDVLLLPFFAFVFLTHWRWAHYRELVDQLSIDEEVKAKYILIQQAINVVIDVPFFFLGVIVLCSLYRTVPFVRKASETPIDQMRKLCYTEFFDMLFDIPFVFLVASMLFIAPWRFLFFFYDMLSVKTREPLTLWTIRYVIISQFLLGFGDVLALFASAVILLTCYKVSTVTDQVQNDTQGFFVRTKTNHDSLTEALEQRSEAHKIVYKAFFKIVSDGISLILDLPYLALLLLMSFTLPWRFVFFLYDMCSLKLDTPLKASTVKKVILCQFLLGLADVLALFLYPVILLTVYRVGETSNTIKNETQGFFARTIMNYDTFSEASQNKFDAHIVVYKNFFKIIADIPSLIFEIPFVLLFALLTLLFPWRSVFFLYDLCKTKLDTPVSAWTVRYNVMSQFLIGIVDVLTVFLYAFVFLTIYRFEEARTLIKTDTQGFFVRTTTNYNSLDEALQQKFDAHFIVFVTFVKIIVDLPSFACIAIVFSTLYRVPSMFRMAYVEGNFSIENLLVAGRMQFLEILKDVIPILVGVFVSVFFFWRTCGFIYGLYNLNSAEDRRTLSFMTLWVGMADIVGIPLGVFVAASFYKIYPCYKTIQDGDLPFFFSSLVRQEGDSSTFKLIELERALQVHALYFKESVEICIDFFHLILASLIIVTVWRAPNLIRRLWNPSSHNVKDEVKQEHVVKQADPAKEPEYLPLSEASKSKESSLPTISESRIPDAAAADPPRIDEITEKTDLLERQEPIPEESELHVSSASPQVKAEAEVSKQEYSEISMAASVDSRTAIPSPEVALTPPLIQEKVEEQSIVKRVYTRREIVVEEFLEWLSDFPAVFCSLFILGIPCASAFLLYTYQEELLAGIQNHEWKYYAFAALGILALVPFRQILLLRDLLFFSNGFQTNLVRLAAYQSFVLYFVDFPAFFSLLVISCTVYRFPRLQRRLKEANVGIFLPFGSANRITFHVIHIEEFLNIIVDLPFMFLAAIVFGTLWRSSALYKDLFETPDISIPKRRQLCFEHFGELMIDIPTILMFLLSSMTIYKTYWLWKEVYNAVPINNRRKIVSEYFLNALMDVPSAFVGLLCFLSVYRGILLIRDLRFYTKTDSERRLAAWENFAMMFLDIPAIPSALVLFLTQYRLGKVRKTLFDFLNVRKECDDRPALAETTSMWWLLFALPFDVKTARLRCPLIAISQFFSILVDFGFLILLTFIYGTLWRVRPLRSKWIEHSQAGSPNDVNVLLDGYRLIIAQQFASLILDVPYIALFVLDCMSIIRTIPAVRDVFFVVKTDKHLYEAIIENFGLIFFDLITIPMYVIINLTYYRAASVHKQMKDKNCSYFMPYSTDPQAAHAIRFEPAKIVLSQFAQIFVDIPFVFMAAVCFMSVYRGYFLYQDFRKEPISVDEGKHRTYIWNQFSNLVFDIPFLLPGLIVVLSWRSSELRAMLKNPAVTTWEKRFSTITLLGWIAFDIFELILCGFLLFALWRIPTLLHSLKTKSFHMAVMSQILLILADLFCILMILVVFLGILRISTFFSSSSQLYNLFYEYSEGKFSKRKELPDLEAVKPRIGEDEPAAVVIDVPPEHKEGEVDEIHPEKKMRIEADKDAAMPPSYKEAVIDQSPPVSFEGISADLGPLLKETILHFERLDSKGAPLSLSWFFVLAMQESWLSITESYKLLLYPFKVFGYAFTPFYHLLKMRAESSEDFQKKNISPEGFPMKPYWSSFLFHVPEKLYRHCPPPNNFETNDKFLAIMFLATPFLLLNELSILFLYPHIACMEVATLFTRSPRLSSLSFLYEGNYDAEFNEQRPAAAEADPDWSQKMADLFSALLQGALLPLLFVLECFFVAAPVAVYYILTSDLLGTAPPTSIIAAQAVFVLIALGTIHLAWRHAVRTNLRFRPYHIYWVTLLVLYNSIRGRGLLLRAYGSLLASATKYCYSLSRWEPRCIFRPIAELILLSLTITWFFWPSIITIYLAQYIYLSVTIPIGIVLLYYAVKIVRNVWRSSSAAAKNQNRRS